MQTSYLIVISHVQSYLLVFVLVTYYYFRHHGRLLRSFFLQINLQTTDFSQFVKFDVIAVLLAILVSIFL